MEQKGILGEIHYCTDQRKERMLGGWNGAGVWNIQRRNMSGEWHSVLLHLPAGGVSGLGDRT